MRLISDGGSQVDFGLFAGYGIHNQYRIDDRFIVNRYVLPAGAEIKVNIILSEITLTRNFGVDRSGRGKTVAITLAQFFDVIEREIAYFCVEVVLRRFRI